jgi:hypothetical protein
MGKRIGVVVCGIALLMGVGAVAPATGEAAEGKTVTLSLTKDYTPGPWTQEAGYSKQAVGKLGFGLKNLLLGWTDLLIEPKEAADAGGNVVKGIGIGVKDAVENTLGGAVNAVTFFLPQVDVTLPEGGTQLLNQ